MKKLILFTVLLSGCFIAHELFARGGRGGGGLGGAGARMGGGGGGMRMGGGMPGGMGRGGMPAMGRTPSMGMPSMSRPSMSRPSFAGGARPGGGISAGRPGGGSFQTGINRPQSNRPALGNLPTPGTRPGTGRPAGSLNRPGFAGSGVRPGGSFQPGFGGRPNIGQLDNFLDIGGGSRRPSRLPAIAGGAAAGGAAAAFLKDLPNPFPADGGFAGRPSTRPGQGGGGQQVRPGDGQFAGGGRPATRPGQGGGGQQFRPGGNTRPSRPGQDGGGQQFRPGDNDRPFRPGRPGGDDRPFRPGDNTRPTRPGDGDRPGRPGTRPGSDWWSQNHHRPAHRPDWDDWHDWTHDRWDHINDHWHDHWHDHHGWYGHDWWSKYHWHYHYPDNINWWGWATWPSITGWFSSYGYTEPVYYNYGSNVYYQDDTVYYGDQPVASADEYAYQAEQIATSVPEDAQPAPEDWMPLGVFAITSADESSTTTNPTNYLQLTVSKQGIIAGSLQNASNGTVKEIEGMVDKQSQRAAWTVVGQTRPIMETGIGNLTQDTASALVHFADGTTQQWLLVRLDKPKDGPTASSAAPATPPQ